MTQKIYTESQQQALQRIQQEINTSGLTAKDLLSLQYALNTEQDTQSHLMQVLYIVGGVIAVIGVTIFIAQYWQEIGFAGRILSTLGIGIVCYVASILGATSSKSVFRHHSKLLGEVFMLISAVLIPMGFGVLLTDAVISPTYEIILLLSAMLATIYYTAWRHTKYSTSLLLVFAATSWFYGTLVEMILVNSGVVNQLAQDSALYATMVYGLSLIFFSRAIRNAHNTISLLVTFVGASAVMIPVLSFGGVYDTTAIIFISLGFFASVYYKSKGLLWSSALYLVVYIIKITTVYFADTFGWSLALIICGFGLIAVAYMSYLLRRTFITPHLSNTAHNNDLLVK